MSPSPARQLKQLDQMRRPVVRRTVVFLCCFCALLLGIHGWSLWAARQGELDETAATTANMALALAAQAETSFKVADEILGETVERVEHEGVDGAAGERLRRRLHDIASHAAEVKGLFVYDAGGNWRATSLSHPPTRANNADRDYFIYHRDHPGRGTHVGKPVRSRSFGVMVIPVSRRIDAPDGSFAGVALVTLDLGYFGRFYDRFDVGRSGTIVLALDDGTLIYRRPYKESMVGIDVSDGPIYQMYKSQGPVGTAMMRPRLDGIERLYSYRHLDGYPLLVSSAQSKEEILAEWWVAVWKMSAVVAFAIAALVLGGLRMLRQVGIRERLESALRQAGSALQEHNVSLKALAESDGLTGLANRRLFEATLARELARARRQGAPFALILADVDFFKKYNDRYGHVAGDDCLRKVAGAIAAGARRPVDLAARYGGEEFAVILPDTGLEGATTVAEKIRAAIAALDIEHADSPFGRVSMSLGVVTGVCGSEADAAWAEGAWMEAPWVEAADALLYEAKAGGRNRVAARVMGLSPA